MDQRFFGEPLIFIISQPRAGSTLLQRLLSGSPEVLSPAEPWLMLHPFYALRDKGIHTEYDAAEASNALDDFLTYYAGGPDTYFNGVSELARVLYTQALLQAGKTIFLDKTPRYYYIIPELYRLFPKARFVFLIRNPLAVLASIIKTWLGQEWIDIYKFRDDLLLAPGLILAGKELLGENAIWIHYEDMVTDPEAAVSSICQRLGIDFNLDMLHYGDREAPIGRRGDMVGIKQHDAPVKDSVETWKSMVELDQTRQFARAYLQELGPELLRHLGYDYDELDRVMQSSAVTRQKAVVPWEIAIRPPSTWSRKDYLVVTRAMAIRRYGYFRGILSYWWANYPRIIRSGLTR